MSYPPPFYNGPTIRLYEHNACLQLADGQKNLLAAFRPELLIDATAEGGSIRFFGAAFGEDAEPGGFRTFHGLTERDAQLAVEAIVTRYRLPRPLEEVSESDLLSDPHAFDGRHIEVTAAWTRGFEMSSFAGAWLTGGPRMASSRDHRPVTGLVRARGVWQSSRDGGYGHLGCSASCLVAYQSWLVEEPGR